MNQHEKGKIKSQALQLSPPKLAALHQHPSAAGNRLIPAILIQTTQTLQVSMLRQLRLQRPQPPACAPTITRTDEDLLEAAHHLMPGLQGVQIVQQQAFVDNTSRCQADTIREFAQWLQEYGGNTTLMDCT